MLTRQQQATRSRCALVVLAATGAATGVALALAPVVTGPVPSVDDALVRLCVLALLAATAWTWLATLSVVAEAWRGCPTRPRAGGPVRRVVLLCCGVALAAPVGTAAADDEPSPSTSIAGLPLPDRATGPARQSHREAAPRQVVVHVVVRPGDCLWTLAAADLRPGAAPARVDARWRATYRLNAAVIGPDPDLIQPGQRLVLPPR